MHQDRYVFSQLMEHLPLTTFRRCWSAICVYVLVTIVKKRLRIDASLYEILHILSLTLFEKTHILSLFQDIPPTIKQVEPDNQLNLFD